MQEISYVAPKADKISSSDLQAKSHVFLQNMFEMAPLSSSVYEHYLWEEEVF